MLKHQRSARGQFWGLCRFSMVEPCFRYCGFHLILNAITEHVSPRLFREHPKMGLRCLGARHACTSGLVTCTGKLTCCAWPQENWVLNSSVHSVNSGSIAYHAPRSNQMLRLIIQNDHVAPSSCLNNESAATNAFCRPCR